MSDQAPWWSRPADDAWSAAASGPGESSAAMTGPGQSGGPLPPDPLGSSGPLAPDPLGSGGPPPPDPLGLDAPNDPWAYQPASTPGSARAEQTDSWTLAPTARAPRRRRRLSPALVAVALLAALGGGLIGGVVGARTSDGGTRGRQVVLGQTAASDKQPPRPEGSVASIAKKVLPSVVSIDVQTGSSAGTGSGVVLSADGLILTNNHVVAPAKSGGTITVIFFGKRRAAAKIIGLDAKSDLAVIQAAGVRGLTKAELGTSSALQVGDLVVAIGSPLGLTGTVTAGIVSATDRPVTTRGEDDSQTSVIDAIQTDAAINPGNSGGALVDGSGAVVGVNSAIATVGSSTTGGAQSGNIGVGFAIPIDQARPIAAELISTGHATHPLLGVTPEDLTEDQLKQLAGGRPGVGVGGVLATGGAAKAGLHKGDVILTLAGVAVDGARELVVEVRKHKVGESVRVVFVRAGKQQTVSVKLGSDGSG